jgi:hypothetical protein
MIFTVGLPKYIVRVFSQEEQYLHFAEQLVRNSNIVAFCSPIALIFQAMLQALQMGTRASFITLGTQLLPLPIFSIVLYYASPEKDPGRLLYAYAIQQGLGVLIAVPLGIGPLRDMLKRAKIEETRIHIDDSGPSQGPETGTDFQDIKAQDMPTELEDIETFVDA